MRKSLITGLALAGLALSGCGNSKAAQVLNGLALTRLAEVRVLQPTPMVALDDRSIMVEMPAKALKFPMYPVERDGDVTVWAAQDSSQLAIRGGMVIASRGFGMDIMSAQVPPVSELVGGAAEHQRVYNLLDGTDSPVQEVFTCTMGPGVSEGGPSAAQHVAETCIGPRKIRNEFWLGNSGQVIYSRQWLSTGAGYVVFGTNGG